MSLRPPDPRKLDVAAFAADAGRLEGRWPLAHFERLGAESRPQGDVVWSVRGQRKPIAGGEPEIWLHLEAHARIGLDCQRCLKPVAWDLDVERSLRFVSGEEAAAELDAEIEDDVLELVRSLDLRELIQDELLLALPLVPMHEHCPQPLSASADPAEVSLDPEQDAHPFAALARLKRNGPAAGG